MARKPKMTDEPTKTVEVEAITESKEILIVPVKMTQEELTECADLICSGLLSVERLEAEIYAIKRNFKEQIDAEMGIVQENRKMYVKKIKEIEKEVVSKYDWDSGIKTIYDVETGEFLVKKDITDKDRQFKLNLEQLKEKNEEYTVYEVPESQVEIKKNNKWISVDFAGININDVFRIELQGKSVEIEGNKEFKAIQLPERNEAGSLQVKCV